MPDFPVTISSPQFKPPPPDPCEACLRDPMIDGGGVDIVANAGTPKAKRLCHLCVTCYATGMVWAAKQALSQPPAHAPTVTPTSSR